MAKRKSKSGQKRSSSKGSKLVSNQLTIFVQWQAGVIGGNILELAEVLESVGPKPSTIDRIDKLRNALVYTQKELCFCETENELSGAEPVMRKLSQGEAELRDLLSTIIEQIVAYYKCSPRKPVPAETAGQLRKIAKRLYHFAGEYKNHVPYETLSDEIRGLADDLRHMRSIDSWTVMRASGISLMLGGIYYDVTMYTGPQGRPILKATLTADEEKTKSYLSQTMAVLGDITRTRRSEQDPKDLQYLADRLDECPTVTQFRDYCRLLQAMTPRDEIPIDDTEKWPGKGYTARKCLKDKWGISPTTVDGWRKKAEKQNTLLESDIKRDGPFKQIAYKNEWLKTQKKKHHIDEK
jgi:hypothetical protein